MTLAPPPPARVSLLPPTDTPIRREGYVMYHDPISSHWLRVYLVLTDTELSLHSTSSRYSRPVRSAVAVGNVTHLYCSLERPGAPEAHIPVLGVLVNDDDLIVLRTPERRLLSDWCGYFAEVMRTPFVTSPPEPCSETDADSKELWKPVEAMAVHRSLMHLQLYAALYRGHAAFASTPTAPTNPTTISSTATATATTTTSGTTKTNTVNKGKSTNKSSLPMRRGSLSADVPRRGPLRRTTDVATRRHADPLAPVTASRLNQTTIAVPVNLKANKHSSGSGRANVNKSALAACDDVAVLMQVQTKRCRSADKVGGKNNSKNTSDHNKENNVSTITNTKGLIPRFSQRRSPSLDKKESENASALASAERHDSPRPSQDGHSVCKSDTKDVNNRNDNKDNNTTINSSALSIPPLAPAPLPTVASTSQLNKLRELREQVETLSARNVDLEIDNANMGARVLELENEVDHMKAGMAEWKRRYASLESQMACQEEASRARWESEKEALLRNVKEEVAEQMQAVRAKFLEKEAALEARIKELQREQEQVSLKSL